MKKIVLCLLMLVAGGAALWADTVSFEAAVNSPRVSLDEVMQLTLTISGVNDNLDPVSLPVIDGFSAKYLGPSTSVSIVNGVYHSERSFVYELFPNKAGRFQIPPISATISGHTYSTNPIDVEVFANSAQAQSASPGQGQEQSFAAESLKDKITVTASADKTDVYLNEKIPLTVKLLVNGVPVRDIQYPQFDKTGFIVDEFEKPSQSSQVLGGVRYDTVRFKTSIYPDRTGELTFGPVSIQGNVLYKARTENPLNQDSSLFGADIFNSFFDSYTARPVNVVSEPLKFHVLPLPDEGRPGDFSGAVSEGLDFQVSVAPLQVKAGDPLTLKMVLKGSGNLKGVQMPVFQSPGFKSYAPQIKGAQDEKTVEEVIIPTSANIKEVPPLRFSYFDTSLKDYKTITRGPFPIQVTAPAADQEFKAVGFSDVSRETPALPAEQFSFSKILKMSGQFFNKLFGLRWFWFGLAVILMVSAAYILWRRFQDRLQNDPAFARRFKAAKEARLALIPAEGYIAAAKHKDFYALLSKTLRDYLANKWHYSSAALSVEEIAARLKAARLDEAHIARLKTLLEQADLVCFAGAVLDAAQMKSDLAVAQGLINDLQQNLK